MVKTMPSHIGLGQILDRTHKSLNRLSVIDIIHHPSYIVTYPESTVSKEQAPVSGLNNS
jgi:hypothetical protein